MIEINNLTTVEVDKEFLGRVAQVVLKGEHPPLGRVPEESDLSIALVGQGRIKELNKKYRGKNRTTDVLAFPNKELGLGEIVICLREVKKNAKRFSSVFKKELAQVLIHGILHLLGYDHEKSKEASKKMEEKQKYYLLKIG